MNAAQKIKIIVATHKKYEMPESSIYLPLHVGAEGKENLGYTKDNTGDHISDKNSSFCELTGLYWGWKNLDCDYFGLAHYRRHFTVKGNNYIKNHSQTVKDKLSCALNKKELCSMLDQYDIFVPKKRNYYIETLYSHYAHSHYAEHLDITRTIIEKKYPDYLKTYDKVLGQRSGYMFNMYIMKKELSDQYCEWLFDILFELEKRIDMPELSQFQGRFYGRVSEIIFNVWLAYQVDRHSYRVKEIGFFYMEPVKWGKKIKAFLSAKFLHRKYEGSF